MSDVSVGNAISDETLLETDDIVSLSPIPQEHVLTASDVTLHYIASPTTQGLTTATPSKGSTKGKTRSLDQADIHEMLVEAIAEQLGAC